MTSLSPYKKFPHRYKHFLGFILLIILVAVINIIPATAHDDGKVQIIAGPLAEGENHLYMLLYLKQDDNISI